MILAFDSAKIAKEGADFMYGDFSMQMEEEAYLGEPVTKALDVLFEDAVLGNYNFFSSGK